MLVMVTWTSVYLILLLHENVLSVKTLLIDGLLDSTHGLLDTSSVLLLSEIKMLVTLALFWPHGCHLKTVQKTEIRGRLLRRPLPVIMRIITLCVTADADSWWIGCLRAWDAVG